MFNHFFKGLFLFCVSFMITGCSTIFSAQEWSDNYALMNGVRSTSPEMIDGNLETIGEAEPTLTGVGNDSVVVVSLPEKKNIYRITLHSDNLNHFVVYVDNGKRTKGEEWQRVIEMRDVFSKRIDLKFKMPHMTNQIKIRILKTNPVVQKYAPALIGGDRLDRTIITNRTPIHLPGRICEIEIYGFKEAEQYK